MPDIALPFSREEYADRLARTRAAMATASVEVLFITDPSNMAWLTGYDGWSFYVHQGVIVGSEGDPVFWGRAMDAAGALRTCYMAPEDIVGYSDNFVMATDRHAMEHLYDTLAERGWQGMRIATEQENYYYSHRAHAVLSSELGFEPVDATGLVNWQRAVKSPAEIGYIRRAARIADHIHETILAMIEPGLPRNRLAAAIYETGIRGAEDGTAPMAATTPRSRPSCPRDATRARPI